MPDKKTKSSTNASEKLWGGRFEEATDRAVEAYTASVHFDCELAEFDIMLSRAHAEMLCECGLIEKSELKAILDGLDRISGEIESGEFEFSPELEDVHMNIESRLSQIAGPAAGRLHTARSRNDQVVTGLKMYIKSAIERIVQGIREVQSALVEQARRHDTAVMPGYTHLQRAQAVPLGHHLMAYFWMLERDAGRFTDCAARADQLPLGAGALAGTALKTDSKYVARRLGFKSVSENSMDAVADRDFLVEFLSACAILMNHLGRSCEEFIIWMSTEFSFVTFPDSLCTGSSIMPQKKNPDVAELIRGKNGRVTGALMALLTTLKGLPLTYNRDLQEDKEPAFDAAKTVVTSLEVYSLLVRGARFDTARLEAETAEGFLNAVDITDYLVRKGMPFRETHHVVGRLVGRAASAGRRNFDTFKLKDFTDESDLFEEDVFDVLDPAKGVRSRSGIGAASPADVRRQIKKAEKILALKK